MTKPKILLDACCGPCSTHSIDVLKEKYEITVLISNHNVQPIEEYNKRKESQRIVTDYHNLKVIVDDYDPKSWFDYVKGLEKEPENGLRCLKCFEYRLNILKKYALKFGFNFVTTTLTISPYKVNDKIFNIARQLFKDSNVEFLEYDFNEDNGYKKSIDLSHKLGLYRQKYCGCIYSKY